MKKHIRVAILVALCFVLTIPTAFAYVVDDTQTLVNTFVPVTGDIPGEDSDVVYVSIAVQKTVYNVGASAIGPEGFSFVLEDQATGDGPVVVSGMDGWAQFQLQFCGADAGKVFNYIIYEINDGRENVMYSTQQYRVQIRVTNDGGLSAVVTVNGEENAIAVFRNVYDDGTVPPPPTGDTANLPLYAGMLLGGAVGAAWLWPRRKEGDNGL